MPDTSKHTRLGTAAGGPPELLLYAQGASVCRHTSPKQTDMPPHTLTQRLALMHCRLLCGERRFRRLASSSRQLGASLAPHVEAPSLFLAAEQALHSSSRSLQPRMLSQEKASEQEQQQQAGRRAGGKKRTRAGGEREAAAGRGAAQQRSGSTAGAVLEGCSSKELDHFLLKYAQLQHLHLLSLVAFVANTLSQTQLAVAFVGAYPFAPDFLALAAAAREALVQRQQQRLQALEQAVLRMETLSGEEDAGEGPAAAAAASGAPAGVGAGAGRGRKGRRGRKPGGPDGGASSLSGVQASGCAAQPQAQLLHCLTQQHVHWRAAELQEHQELCWAELGAVAPACQPQQQPVKQGQQKKQAVVENGQLTQQPGQQVQQAPPSADAIKQPQQHLQHLQLGSSRREDAGLETHCRKPDATLHSAAAHAMDVDC